MMGGKAMSLIMAIKFSEGYLLSGDSRLSYKNDPTKHSDNTYKIFCYDKRIGVAFHHCADIDGNPIENVLEDFLSSADQTLTVYGLAKKLKEHIKNLKSDLDTKFHILGYEKEECLMYEFHLQQSEDIIQNHGLYVTGEQTDFAFNQLKESYQENKALDEAVNYIKKIYEKTEQVFDSVGGEIDILMLSPKGEALWIQQKKK